jgi:glycosyltransferase involved in cell wall biosynthesis
MRLIANLGNARPFSAIWLAARLETFSLPKTAGVVCISRYTQELIASLARRTWIVPNAVDESFYEIAPELSLKPVPRILCVGLLCPRKNQNAFITALDPLAEKRKFELVFYGLAGDDKSYAETFFQLVKDRPWCKYAGFADRDQLKSQFRQSTLLALPSVEDNCPMVILEAMAAGVPVVAANVGGVPELIEDGVSGWLCNPLDAQSMMKAIEHALSNEPLRIERAKQARQNSLARYHPSVIASQHIEIYRSVLTPSTPCVRSLF